MYSVAYLTQAIWLSVTASRWLTIRGLRMASQSAESRSAGEVLFCAHHRAQQKLKAAWHNQTLAFEHHRIATESLKKAWAELNDAVEFVGDCISAIPEEMEWVPTTSVRREYVFAKGVFAGEYITTPPPKPAADRTSPRTPPTHEPIAETIAETQDAAVAPELPSFTRAVTLARTRSMVDLDTEDSSGKRPRTERSA